MAKTRKPIKRNTQDMFSTWDDLSEKEKQFHTANLFDDGGGGIEEEEIEEGE